MSVLLSKPSDIVRLICMQFVKEATEPHSSHYKRKKKNLHLLVELQTNISDSTFNTTGSS